MRLSRRAFLGVAWLLAVILGAVHAWADRFFMNADGISYIEMGNAYWRGDWAMAINGYWSPLYSWLVGLAMVLLEPTPYWEFPTAHLVNLVVYVCALACFHFFLTELLRDHQQQDSRFAERGASLPAWALWLLGYTLFVWSSLTMRTLQVVTPDMSVAAFVYLASGILLRIRGGPVSWIPFALLGLVLGFGYLAKFAMFPLAMVFLGVAVLSLGDIRRAIPLGLVTLVVFLLVAGPFVLALSTAKGRFTFGDTAKLNYLQHINGAPTRHWQGTWPPGSGTPTHPTRQIFDNPAIYEYGSPIGGTYPPWYDPSYWNEGITPQPNPRKQIRIATRNLRGHFDMFLRSQGFLVAGFLILFIAGARGWLCLRDIREQWRLLIPALSALAMYSLVHSEPRYWAGFIVVLWLGIASAVRLRESAESRRLGSSVTAAMVAGLLLIVGVATVPKASTLAGDLLRITSRHTQWHIAEGLRQMGVRPGDKVGLIGRGTPRFHAYWARLARVQIIAEIASTDVNEFLAGGRELRSRVLETFASTGAKFVVAHQLPNLVASEGWQRVGDDHFLYSLGPRL